LLGLDFFAMRVVAAMVVIARLSIFALSWMPEGSGLEG
jgi:hypothetical protein